MTILIIEDDAGLSELIHEIHLELGFNTVFVQSASEAVKWLNNNQPYLMVVDYSLPDLNGKEFIIELKNMEIPVAPFIVSTGKGDERIAVEMMKLGAKDYIIKDSHFLEKFPEVIKRVCREIENENKRTQAEESLKLISLRYQTLFTKASDGIMQFSIEGNLIDVNESFAKMHGYSVEEMKKLNINNLDTPKTAKGISERINRLLAGEHLYFEVEHFHKDGHIFPLEVSSSCITIGNEKFILSFHRDVSERKRAEEAIRLSEGKLQAITSNISDTIIQSDRSGRITFINHIQPGLTNEQVFSGYVFDFVPDEQKPIVEQALYSVFDEGKTYSYETSGPGPYGEWRSYEVFVSPILAGNKIESAVFLAHDITERKQIELFLKENEERFRRISNISSDVAYSCVKNKNGNYFIDWINGAVEQIFGYSVNEMIELKCWGKLVIDEDLRYFNKYVLGLKPGIIESCELRLRKKSGEIIWLKSLAECVLEENHNMISRLYGGLVNITEQKRAEEELMKAKAKAEESDKLKTAFLQNMSHEIRTPLNGIIGFSNLLQEECLSKEEIREFTNLIKNSGNRLIEIVNNVLDISKIETGQIEIKNKSFSINSLITDLYSFFSSTANAKGINLSYNNYFDEEKSLIVSDDTKLNQVLINLINNSIKFTHSGNIEFGYKIFEKDIQFYVKDTGIGISEEMKDKIFDRFTQEELSISRNYEGAGLGLAICKGLVELLGGRIWLESEKNNGTTFFFTIPYFTSSSIEENKRDSNKINIKAKKNKILIAEDDLVSFQYLKRVLKGDDYIILFAEDGKQALEIVRNTNDIDLILMDIRMPVMDGMEATKLIKEIKPDIPVIAQTAYAFSSEKEMIMSNGFQDYIAKPIDKDTLIKLIEKYV